MSTPISDRAQRRVHTIKRLQTELPRIGAQYAKEIFEQVFQGDGVADTIEELMIDCEGFEAVGEALLVETTMDDHYTDLVWNAITAALAQLVRDHQS